MRFIGGGSGLAFHDFGVIKEKIQEEKIPFFKTLKSSKTGLSDDI